MSNCRARQIGRLGVNKLSGTRAEIDNYLKNNAVCLIQKNIFSQNSNIFQNQTLRAENIVEEILNDL